MGDESHIQAEHYVEVREGDLPSASLALKILDHLAAVCSKCAAVWRQLAGSREHLAERVRREMDRFDASRSGTAPLDDPYDEEDLHKQPDHHLPLLSREAREEDEEIERLKAIRRDALRQTWKLLQAPPHRRAERIDRAISHFRSLAVAEHMIERCRELIHSEPAEAESLASLVPRVLDRVPGIGRSPEAAELLALAAAWRANALRVSGDLPAADRAFADLRRQAATGSLEDLSIVAELLSLEASLRIDQRRGREAEELLERAALLLRYCGDEHGLDRVLIQHGNLLTDLDRPEEALDRFRAVGRESEAGGGTLRHRIAAVHGSVIALCDLGRHEEARQILDAHGQLFEEWQVPFAGAALRNLRGRIALCAGQLIDAEAEFEGCREAHMTLGRRYDAALASLDLAEVYLLQGRLKELRNLTRELLPIFRACQVPKEVMGTLRILFDTTAVEELSMEALGGLRKALRDRR